MDNGDKIQKKVKIGVFKYLHVFAAAFFMILCILIFNTLNVQAASFYIDEEIEDGESDEGKGTDYKEVLTKKLSLKKTKITSYIGDKFTLQPICSPKNVTNKSLKYKSSNKSVAAVNKKGVVTCKKKGTATITIAALDGSNKKVKCKITVKKAKFTERKTRPAFSNSWYYSSKNIYYNYDRYAPTGNAFSGGLYCYGNCTWYACGRAGEVLDKAKKTPDLSIFGPNPYGIWQNNKMKGTYKTGNKPKVGALVVFGIKYGSYHIAMVEKIENGVVYVSESGYKTGGSKPSKNNIVFHYGPITDWNRDREIIGYIYLL